MCGIAGRLELDGAAPKARAQVTAMLETMREAMVHRGPDGAGLWLSEDGRVGLAHRRLAIVDLADNAGQPMTNETGDIRVTFNGEIYNHLGLRRELVAAGHRFATDHADTEVIVHGYEQWGIEGLIERLDGMFAFALWDAARRRLVLVRDRVGIKPLYFTRNGGTFLFASEIKAIVADRSVPRDVEPAALNHYLSFMVAPAPLTMFRGIHKLPAGHWLSIDEGGRMAVQRYWDAVPGRGGDAAAADAEGLAAGVLARLEAAVEKRMMSDVPVGVFLSGGIDSSANVALMSRLVDHPLRTFTVGFSDHPELNELDEAADVARRFGTEHHEVLIDAGDMMGYVDALVHHQDEPIADWVCIPLHFVSRLARECGVPVVHVGEGSDEQFCGYDGYMDYLRLHRLFWTPYMRLAPAPLRRAIAAAASRFAGAGTRPMRIADMLGRAARGQEIFWSGAHAIWNVDKAGIATAAIHGGGDGLAGLRAAGFDVAGLDDDDSGAVAGAYLDRFDRAHPGRDQLTRMIHSEFRLRLPELLLMRVDKMTMANSVEARVPFLDSGLVDYTMDIPIAAKLGGRASEKKHLLKAALRDVVPADVLRRPKRGFGAPMAAWLRGEFGRRAESEVLGSAFLQRGFLDRDRIATLFADHRGGRRDHGLTLWTIYNVASWHERWIAAR